MRARAVLATVHDDVGNGIVVPPYLLFPVPRERSGATDDIVNEGACFEHCFDVACDVVGPLLFF